MPLRQAIKLPIYVTTDVVVEKLKRGQIQIDTVRRQIIMMGKVVSPAMNAFKFRIYLNEGAVLHFKGCATLAKGTVIRCDKNAKIEIGNGFLCNCNCFFRSTSLIGIGNDCAMGWDVTLNTTDGHSIWHKNSLVEKDAPIKVGNHVWIASGCTLNKGVVISNNNVIAQKSVVTKTIPFEHSLIGGIPAKLISSHIDWKL